MKFGEILFKIIENITFENPQGARNIFHHTVQKAHFFGSLGQFWTVGEPGSYGPEGVIFGSPGQFWGVGEPGAPTVQRA